MGGRDNFLCLKIGFWSLSHGVNPSITPRSLRQSDYRKGRTVIYISFFPIVNSQIVCFLILMKPSLPYPARDSYFRLTGTFQHAISIFAWSSHVPHMVLDHCHELSAFLRRFRRLYDKAFCLASLKPVCTWFLSSSHVSLRFLRWFHPTFSLSLRRFRDLLSIGLAYLVVFPIRVFYLVPFLSCLHPWFPTYPFVICYPMDHASERLVLRTNFIPFPFCALGLYQLLFAHIWFAFACPWNDFFVINFDPLGTSATFPQWHGHFKWLLWGYTDFLLLSTVSYGQCPSCRVSQKLCALDIFIHYFTGWPCFNIFGFLIFCFSFRVVLAIWWNGLLSQTKHWFELTIKETRRWKSEKISKWKGGCHQ